MLQQQREEFLKRLKENPDFQEFVVKPIKKELDSLSDITRRDGSDFEELGKKFLIQKLLVIELRKILSFLE
jgi:hypothetical protein